MIPTVLAFDFAVNSFEEAMKNRDNVRLTGIIYLLKVKKSYKSQKASVAPNNLNVTKPKKKSFLTMQT